jgi:ADP-ribose pyrophosphatase YjhB (NUDIX family)
MTTPSNPRWLDWTKRLQAIAQTGLTYAADRYDIERYTELRQVAAEMLAAGSGQDVAPVLAMLTQQTGYATPKVDTRGVVFRDDQVLLVRERAEGRWTLPGGWADVCASPAENVEREVWEESGYRVRAVKLLAVFDRSKHHQEPLLPFHVYKLFMLCSLLGGEATPSFETDAIGFFSEGDLPALSLGRVTPGQLARMFEHHRNPELPADFDPVE